MQKAKIQNAEVKGGAVIECMFNPPEYAIAKTNNWSQRASTGEDVPALTFTGGGTRTLTLELFFDCYEKGESADVRNVINKLWKLTAVDKQNLYNKKTKKARPPLVIFSWGKSWSFEAAITSLTVRYTLFTPQGTPVRATANVTFMEAGNKLPGTNPTSQTLQAGRKRREVRPHDTLALIAHEEYGDASLWRLIAEENDVEDPLHLTPGAVLAIPPAS